MDECYRRSWFARLKPTSTCQRCDRELPIRSQHSSHSSCHVHAARVRDFGRDQLKTTKRRLFFRDGDKVFRTYFINNRGDEAMGTVWSYLDITPLGRQETWEDSPEGYPQTAPYKWWNWHDNYDAEPTPHPKWVDITTDPQGSAIRRREEEAIAS